MDNSEYLRVGVCSASICRFRAYIVPEWVIWILVLSPSKMLIGVFDW